MKRNQMFFITVSIIFYAMTSSVHAVTSTTSIESSTVKVSPLPSPTLAPSPSPTASTTKPKVSPTPSPIASPATSPKPSSSPTASPVTSPTPGTENISPEEVNEQVKNRIKEAVKEQSVQTEIKYTQKRAIVGRIEKVTSEAFTIRTMDSTETVRIDQSKANFLQFDKKNVSINPEDLEIGAFAVVMGYVDTNEVLEARRVLMTKEDIVPATETRVVHVGFLKDLTKKDFGVQPLSGSEIRILLGKKSTILKKDGKAVKLTAIPEQTKIVVTALKSDGDTPTETLLSIHVLDEIE